MPRRTRSPSSQTCPSCRPSPPKSRHHSQVGHHLPPTTYRLPNSHHNQIATPYHLPRVSSSLVSYSDLNLSATTYRVLSPVVWSWDAPASSMGNVTLQHLHTWSQRLLTNLTIFLLLPSPFLSSLQRSTCHKSLPSPCHPQPCRYAATPSPLHLSHALCLHQGPCWS